MILPLSLSLNPPLPQCLFLVWCMAPVTWNGSAILYSRVVRPVFLRHQATLDSVVNNLSDKAKNMADTVTKEGETQTHKLDFYCGDAETRFPAPHTSVFPQHRRCKLVLVE